MPTDINDLLAERAQVIREARALLDNAEAKGRDLNRDERKQWNMALARAEAIGEKVQGEAGKTLTSPNQDFDKALAELDEPMNTPTVLPDPSNGRREARLVGAGGDRVTFQNLFPDLAQRADDGGFKSFQEYFQAVMSSRHDPRLYEIKAQHLAGEGERGGFAVPLRFAATLFDAIVEESVFAPRAQVEPLDAISIEAPAWADLDQSDGALYGGFTARWSGEDDEQSEQEAKLRLIKLTANGLRLFTSLSRELATFSRPNMQQQLFQALARTIGHGIDVAAMVGDGVGKPLGVLESESLISVNRSTGNQIQWNDIARMIGRLYSGAMGDSIFIANPDVLPELLNLQDDSKQLIWQPSAREGEPDRLAGRPLFFRDRLPTLGDKGDLTLVSPRHYILALSPQVWLDSSEGPHWFRDRTALRAVTFADGQPQWPTVYTPPNGGQTKSWAVTLSDQTV